MKTRVINIARACKAADEVYVGRWNRGYFGSPIIVGKKCPVCGSTHGIPGTTIDCYREYMERRLNADPEFRARVAGLKGKTLVCHCAPGPCHGNVLAEAAEELGGVT